MALNVSIRAKETLEMSENQNPNEEKQPEIPLKRTSTEDCEILSTL